MSDEAHVSKLEVSLVTFFLDEGGKVTRVNELTDQQGSKSFFFVVVEVYST